MERLGQADATFHEYMVYMHLGRRLINKAVSELGVELPVKKVHVNSEIIPKEAQSLIAKQSKTIDPAEVATHLENGSIPINRIADYLQVDGAKTIYIFLNAVSPNWKRDFYSFFDLETRKRVRMVPPEIVEKMTRYRDLKTERQMLGLWRSARKTGKLWVSETFSDPEIARNILAAADIIKLGPVDIKMLENMRNSSHLIDKYRIIAEMATFNNEVAIKSIDEIMLYIQRIIPGLLETCDSSEEFEAALQNKVFAFATTNS